jgi:RecB family exonuclease
MRRAPAFRRNGAAELEAYRLGGGFASAPAYLEQPFDVAVDGWKLRGVIDRIDRTGGGWRIIDYKSGRPIARRRRDLQVALYALGATSALKLEPIELEVVYLASGQSVRVEKVDGLMHEAEVEGTEVAEGIKAGRFPSRPERRRCRLCPYRLACADAL